MQGGQRHRDPTAESPGGNGNPRKKTVKKDGRMEGTCGKESFPLNSIKNPEKGSGAQLVGGGSSCSTQSDRLREIQVSASKKNPKSINSPLRVLQGSIGKRRVVLGEKEVVEVRRGQQEGRGKMTPRGFEVSI